MKVNINVEIDDARRNALAQILDGKPVKRLATRDEVRELVAALIESLATAQDKSPSPEQQGSFDRGDLVAVANARVAEMREAGEPEERIKSWLRGFWKKPKEER